MLLWNDPFTARSRWEERAEREFNGNAQEQRAVYSLPVDVVEGEDGYLVRAAVPGLRPEDLEITFADNALTIQAETAADEPAGGAHYLLRERRQGRFQRTLAMPPGVDGEGIQARCADGLLELILPKRADARPRRIAIGGGQPDEQVIEGRVKTKKR